MLHAACNMHAAVAAIREILLWQCIQGDVAAELHIRMPIFPGIVLFLVLQQHGITAFHAEQDGPQIMRFLSRRFFKKIFKGRVTLVG
jgi:hypothetical protein